MARVRRERMSPLPLRQNRPFRMPRALPRIDRLLRKGARRRRVWGDLFRSQDLRVLPARVFARTRHGEPAEATMGIDVRASGNDLELWHVQLGGGVVRTMNLDELDAAFQSGTIGAHTLVLKAGSLHWTTLADIAGIEDEPQPNSMAPVATDIASSSLLIPPLPSPDFNVSHVVLATAELAAFRPKRRAGRVFGAIAVLALIGGAAFGLARFGAIDSVASLVMGANAESARAAAVAPPPAAAEPPRAAPSVPIESLPSATNGARATVSIDSLPSAAPEKNDKSDKKTRKEAAPKKRQQQRAPRKAASTNDPTQRGSGQFDPLNGNL
ncbi:MAG: hypothetical protein K0S65_3806 [Labilithrix sp.]|nr:hypothetical protein [Labilithrix sp.]